MIQPVNNQMQPMYNAQMMPMYTPQMMQAQPQNNAVKIDIINPQAGATSPYAMPQASAYPQYVPNGSYAPAFYYPMMQQSMPQQMAPAQQPVQTMNPQQIQQAPAQVVMPQPVVIPQPVVTTQPQQIINNAPTAMPVPPQAQTIQEQPVAIQQPAEQPVAQTAVAPQVETPATPPMSVDLNQIVSRLNSTDMKEQAAAIEEIADMAQTNPNAATQLLDTQIMDALGNIIKKDTTQIQGPTAEQISFREKLINGEKLSPEQEAIANKLSDLELANGNKQFALYTIAILQKLLSTEVEKLQGTKLEMKDLPMINDVVKVAKADENPMLRAAALSALSYIATPENKQLLTTMFEQSQKDSDPNVQAVATEALNKLSQI